MLYFTETGWAPPDILATNDEFERDYDQEELRKEDRTTHSQRPKIRQATE